MEASVNPVGQRPYPNHHHCNQRLDVFLTLDNGARFKLSYCAHSNGPLSDRLYQDAAVLRSVFSPAPFSLALCKLGTSIYPHVPLMNYRPHASVNCIAVKVLSVHNILTGIPGKHIDCDLRSRFRVIFLDIRGTFEFEGCYCTCSQEETLLNVANTIQSLTKQRMRFAHRGQILDERERISAIYMRYFYPQPIMHLNMLEGTMARTVPLMPFPHKAEASRKEPSPKDWSEPTPPPSIDYQVAEKLGYVCPGLVGGKKSPLIESLEQYADEQYKKQTLDP